MVDQVEYSGHVMGHVARDRNSVELQAVGALGVLDQKARALVVEEKLESRQESRQTLLVVELAVWEPEKVVELETTYVLALVDPARSKTVLARAVPVDMASGAENGLTRSCDKV